MVLEAIIELERACRLDWSAIEPAIFGTLFERSLDPSKRSQLGAHYTSREDIMLIVEPVLMEPLYREWNTIREQAAAIRPQYEAAVTIKDRSKYEAALKVLQERMLKRLREIKILDPACGSGNFLYVSLQLLMNLEKAIIIDPVFAGLTLRIPEVHPQQLYGIETNIIAHDLASIVVWIGYIQWRQNNGYLSDRKPILEDLHENIRHMDAIMTSEGAEPDWPSADVIVGNPPFLGGKKMRTELGNYVDTLFQLYTDRVPPEADLVCYWFEKARAQIANGKTKRAGLLATNSIRGGTNREVLNRIKETGDIFMAWSDRKWILDGAAVRVAMVGFSLPNEDEIPVLDGRPVAIINADLTANINLTTARRLSENFDLAYMGVTPAGSFDFSKEEARKMLAASNLSLRSNSDVVKPYYNAIDLVQQPRNVWTIDFGTSMQLDDAKQYELPFNHVISNVYPVRQNNNRQSYREKWWIYAESRPMMRNALLSLSRYLATPMVAKHRVFVWLSKDIVPANLINVIARDDDYFFGVLHSRLHELWSLRMGTWLGVGNDPRYTPTTTFETFPFPWSPSHEDTTSPAYQTTATAAKQLHEERQAWLDIGGKERTLTNLYNALNVWRGKDKMKVKDDAAPRLDVLHETLDRAVCDAYGWSHTILQDEDEILRLLLELNLERSAG